MESVIVSNLGELQAAISNMGNGSLFRGQVRDYRADGHPSATTSFDRHGCIPSEMAKWSRYASLALSHLLGSEFDVFENSQALLQHYGWRSFFLDATSSPEVASWFASQSFKSNVQVEMCEDYEERPIWLRKFYASYQSDPGEGHLYLFDREKIEATIGCIDLSGLRIEGRRPRFVAQHALIVGPLRNQALPLDCYKAHISGDREIFKEFAEQGGLCTTNDVFPPPEDDPVLQVLLGLPWNRISVDNEGFRAFRRTIELPEYQSSFRKIVPGWAAFYCGSMIQDIEGLATDPDVAFFGKVPELAVFGVSNQLKSSFPSVLKELGSRKFLCFEVDQLVGYSSELNTARYGKGIYVSKHDQNLYQIGEIIAEHPGMDLLDAGLVRGWFYSVDGNGVWSRVEHAEQCSCKSVYTHEAHFSALSIIEDFLSDPTGFDGIA